MEKSNKKKVSEDINDILLECNRLAYEAAVDLSIRTGTPMVFQEDGKIIKVWPKFKYVLVPIDQVSDQ